LSPRNVDPTAEQEVDLGSWWGAIVARWWLPLAGLVVGAFIGYLISLGGKEVWKASANVYLGASYSSAGGVFLQGPQANPSTAGTIARAESSIETAAAKAGMPASQLRGNVATQAVSTGAGSSLTRTTGNPLVKITVQASTRRRAAAAANALANVVVEELAPFADRKIATLKQRIAQDQAEIDSIRQATSSSDPVARAVIAVQLGGVLDDQLQAKQLLIQAQEIERPRVLTRAAAVKSTARSRRNSVVVAAFLGLVIGLIAALLWEPLARRR
jgi:capsular polysaccharide biosynthesis protein